MEARCHVCGGAMRPAGNIAISRRLVCENRDCTSHKRRRLACPRADCAGRELDEKSYGTYDQVYTCPGCGFRFDVTGERHPLPCEECGRSARVFPNESGFRIMCPTHPHTAVDVRFVITMVTA